MTKEWKLLRDKLAISLSLTNWTVGFWWVNRRTWKAFGIDLGPLEVVYSFA